MKLIIIILGLIILFSALVVKAADLAIEFPCPPAGAGLGDCPDQSSSIPNYIIRFYQFGVGIAGVLAVGMIAAGAVYRIIHAGNSSKQQEGTEMIKSAIWGVVLLLGSYLILRTINPQLVLLKLPELEPLDLPAEYAYQPIPGEETAPDIDISPEAQAYCTQRTRTYDSEDNFANCLRGWNKCDGCVPLDPSVPLKPDQCTWGRYPSDCLVRQQTNTGLMALKTALGDIFQVTEAWPPTVKHQSDGHYNGCAVDIKITDRGEDLCQTVQRTINAAIASGLNPFNEYAKSCPNLTCGDAPCKGKKVEKEHLHLTAQNCP